MRFSIILSITLFYIVPGSFPSFGQSSIVFTNNFDADLPVEMSVGSAALTPVQGYAGVGPIGNQFATSFLRSATGNTITLTLSNLPPHRFLGVTMLFAAIDSLDGTGAFPSGDFFTVTLDTNVVFKESFANASPSQVQSYVPPPGAELARHVDLGFGGPGGYYTDSAYDFGMDPRFKNLPHTNSVATLTFAIEGDGAQSLDDESWAMDNLGISISIAPQPVIQQIVQSEPNVILTWSAVSTIVYRVQSTSGLPASTWDDLLPLVTATGPTADFTSAPGNQNKFYRIMVVE